MTPTIDPVKLKAAAEHLDWVLRQYPDSDDVQRLLRSLTPFIEDARASHVQKPVDRLPGAYNFGDGLYIPYKKPSVDEAYVSFAIEMEGGLTKQEKQLNTDTEAMRRVMNMDAKS